MHELTLILTDLYVAEGTPAPQAVPTLPALSTAMSRASSQWTGDWRRWILRQTSGIDTDRVPVAAMLQPTVSGSRIDKSVAGLEWWLATSVHLDAAIDHVRMQTTPVMLTAQEWNQLGREFDDLFGCDGFQFVAGSGATAVIGSSHPYDAQTCDPARVFGGDIREALPSGLHGPVLRRLMTGTQMWLHAHPMNAAREQHGLRTVNAFWIWGGGHMPSLEPAASVPQLWTCDPFLLGLWGRLRGDSGPLPTSFDEGASRSLRDVIAGVTCVTASNQTPAQGLEKVEHDWIAPALAALNRGRLRSLRIHLNDRLHRLTRLSLHQFWRRRRHWLEATP